MHPEKWSFAEKVFSFLPKKLKTNSIFDAIVKLYHFGIRHFDVSVVRKTAGLSTGAPCFKIGGYSLGVLQFWSGDPPPIERQTVHFSWDLFLKRESGEREYCRVLFAPGKPKQMSASRDCKSSASFNSSDHIRLSRDAHDKKLFRAHGGLQNNGSKR